jgi:hypothetical protein
MEDNKISLELSESRDAIEFVPTWEPQFWWLFVAFALFGILVLLIFVVTRKKPNIDSLKEKREAYLEAKSALAEEARGDVREKAIRVSMILRSYLAKTMNEPALYETQEEFVARHDGLKDLPDSVKSEVGFFFSKLAAIKYAPDDVVGLEIQGTVAEEGAALLERIHAA